MMSFTFEPIFQSWIALITLSTVIVAIPWLVPVEGRALTSTQRLRLQLLRTTTAIVLLLSVFRPSIVRTDSLPTEATLAVLLDRSRSMTLPGDSNRNRTEIQNEAFAKLLPAIESLSESLQLKTLVYQSAASELLIDDQTSLQLSQSPDGNATDIAKALEAAIQSSTGKPLAGVILMGDGVEVLPPSDSKQGRSVDPQSSARTLASLDVPLWTVAIGPPGDLNQVRDVEVSELAESLALFSGNEAKVDFVIRTRALAGKAFSATVRMIREDDVSKSSELAIRSVTPDASEQSIAMSIPIIAPEPGRYRMEVRVEPQEGETLLSNNSQVAFVDVRKGGGRVLYLEGQPRLEQSLLLQSLRRFPDLQVTYRWIAADTKPKWPIDLGFAQNPNAFDVVIIGDLPAEAVGLAQWEVIAKRVSDGAALLMIGGLETFAKGNYASSPLAALLPVKLDASLKDWEGDLQMVAPQSHPVTSLSPSNRWEDQVSVWESLPSLIGANRFADLRVAPGIEVLLETTEGEPLLVVGEYGAGRVATFAGDSTWRWVRQGKSAEHRRFWRQMLLWLLNRDTDVSDSLNIKLSRRRADLGQSIDYVVTSGKEGQKAPLLFIVGEDNLATPLQPQVVVPATRVDGASVEGSITNLKPGMYRLRTVMEGNEAGEVEQSFQIVDQDAELRQPFADHTYLSQLASQTANSGGAMFLPDSIDELIDLITQLRRNAESPVVQKYRLGDTPTSAWPLFIVLSGLLGTEWYLRRRWGLA
jgi:uncharacterized membrane protein